MDQYRVLVVDDSAFMRKIIADLIEGDPKFTVVDTAVNGIDAVTKTEQCNPDVITLDLEMPLMNGIDALQQILKKHKIPIIMLSGISEANTRDTIKALQFGAFDFIRKPTGVGANSQDILTVGEMLLEKLKIAVLTRRKPVIIKPREVSVVSDTKLQQTSTKSKQNLLNNGRILSKASKDDTRKKTAELVNSNLEVKNVTSLVKKTHQESVVNKVNHVLGQQVVHQIPSDKLEQKLSPKVNSSITSIIAIGTSTGGPRALHEVITNLPKHLPAPIVIVQHMPPRFTKSLAQRLDSFSELEVFEAEHGMKLDNGKAYVAPGGKHMVVKYVNSQYVVHLTNDPPQSGHRPSVDVLFDSLLDFPELQRYIVLMTGMGSDGAQAMLRLSNQGVAATIAEAEESCIVYGMPRSAVELGAASKVLPLSQIAPELLKLLLKS